MRFPLHLVWLWFAAVGLAFPLIGDPTATIVVTNAPADALSAKQRLRVAPGLKLELWASEPLIQNITSVSYDNQGRAYVVESGRRRTSVFDIRGLTQWLDDDLALRTETERAAFLRTMLDPRSTNYPAFVEALTKSKVGGFQDFNRNGVLDWRDLEVESERIRLVTDTDGNGQADTATTFADGFNGITSGVAAGVLVEGTNVWFACIPDLWRMPAAGQKASGPAGQTEALPSPALTPAGPPARSPLLSGFGVHLAFGGHDLHGLIKGPDGRIYFSIADRGTYVTNREGKVISLPDCGAVFRCEPDGSNFEVFAQGLRNPQELAFDDFGNLWTADNNGDGGDKARWTLVLEGADYGWTIGWQWLPKMGAWNSERLWHTRESNTAAYLVPPVAHIGHGPAGIAHYPGTGLGERYRDHFFYADFPGGIRTFRIEPEGAFFKVGQAASLSAGSGNVATDDSWKWLEDNSAANFTGKLLWDLSPVDVTFPPFGGVIVADWVQGWEKTGKGRLWHITDPTLTNDPQIAEVRRLLAEGMTKRSEKELLALLGHHDQRVRLEAQWELAGRGAKSFAGLKKVALKEKSVLARIHAIWGIGQIARAQPVTKFIGELMELMPLLRHENETLRQHAAGLFGEGRLANANNALVECMGDSSPPVRVAAVLALEKISHFSGGRRYEESAKEFLGRKGYDLLYGAEGGAAQSARQYLEQKVVVNLIDFRPRLAELVATNAWIDPLLLHAATVAFSSREGQAAIPMSWANGYLTNWPGADNLLLVSALAARRQSYAYVESELLRSTAPRLVLEAARAINDVPIPAALPALAALLQPKALDHVQWPEEDGSGPPSPRPSPPGRGGNAASPSGNDPSRPSASPSASPNNPAPASAPAPNALGARPNASPSRGGEGRGEGGPTLSRSNSLNFTRDEWRTWVLRRAVNAAFRLGGGTNAAALAQFAARTDAPESVRVEALEDLADWARPPKRDKIVGLHRPLPARDLAPARAALAAVWPQVTMPTTATNVLLAVLRAGAALKPDGFATSLATFASHPSAAVRAEAAGMAAADRPMNVTDLIALLDSGSLLERRNALARLAEATDTAAVTTVTAWMGKLVAGTVPLELQADVLEAARKVGRAASLPGSPTPPTAMAGRLPAVLAAWTNSLPKDDSLARYRVALHGGDAANGRRLFAERADWGCQRCHKLGGEGGDVGPDLTGLGRTKGRDYVLRAILEPNAEIAAGFETLLVEKRDDTALIGILKEETATELMIVSPEEGRVVVKKADVKSRNRGLSTMPDGLGDLMTFRELRDVIEALSQ